ncbi:hypothetical protein Bca52824_000010 [Brassica carinata]|uniref:Sororin C-terminal region domain-containing protein n=1 Tax=Brassica carinata TaxID=52824 RepID=A0A8X7WHC0_BRACI|nr:hypothetical protein Bca52824_000010 [Brassica carinata]
MKPHRPVSRRLQRKPLGDCTNTTHQRSSSSSSVKFANPSLTSSLKRLVHQTSLKEKKHTDLVVVDNSKTTAEETAPEPICTSLRPVTRRVSADLRFPAIAPSRPPEPNDVDKSARVRPVTRRASTDLDFPTSAPPPRRENSRSGEGAGGGDKEVAEPNSVYTVRRKASGRKRSKDAASSTSAVANLRLDLISSPGKKTNEKKLKLSKAAPRKRQRTANDEGDNLSNGVSQDYIEKQKAYFAEVDAFELAEEEVSSSDLD